MTRLRIKICGLTREADVEAVAALDIDAVGFVLWPASPRAVTPATARPLYSAGMTFFMPGLALTNPQPMIDAMIDTPPSSSG